MDNDDHKVAQVYIMGGLSYASFYCLEQCSLYVYQHKNIASVYPTMTYYEGFESMV